METTGERIRQARREKGLTQGQLGKAAGISAAAISAIESGDTKEIKPTNLFPLARRLGKDAEWLVTGRRAGENYHFREMSEAAMVRELDMLPSGRVLSAARQLDSLPVEISDHIIALIDACAASISS